MGGLLTSFGVGVSGLRVSQSSLTTTSHNIVNSDTDGFTRQNVIQNAAIYANLGMYGSGTNQVGRGAVVAQIYQVRNVFLDASYRQEVGRQGFYDAQSEALAEVENLFGELEGVQFQNSLEDLWKSIQELQKEPDSIVTRGSLLQTAGNFLERSEAIYKQMNIFQQNLNTKVKNTVERINEIGKQINSLNKTIRKFEVGVENANDYRDERNALLDELGGLVKISTHEYEDSTVSVTVEGYPFVGEMGVTPMALEMGEDQLRIYDPVWGEDGDPVFNFDVACTSQANTDIGTLKGLLLARGKTAGNYKDIPVMPEVEDFTTGDEDYNPEEDEAYQAALKDYAAAVEVYNREIAPSVMMNVQAQFDQLIHGVVTTINDILCPDLTGTWDSGGDIVWRDRTGKIISAEDAPQWTSGDLEEYATEELDEEGEGTGRFTIRILDTANAPVGMDEDATMGEALFTRKSEKRYQTVDMGEEKLYVYTQENEADWYTMFSLGEIEVNPAISSNLSKLPLSRNTETGDFSIDVAAELSAAWDEKFAALDPNTLTENTFLDYYTAFTANVANTGQTLKAIASNQAETAAGVDDQRQQVMGVSSDEQLTLMIKYQHAYNASSRYITVIDEMLEHIITQLG